MINEKLKYNFISQLNKTTINQTTLNNINNNKSNDLNDLSFLNTQKVQMYKSILIGKSIILSYTKTNLLMLDLDFFPT